METSIVYWDILGLYRDNGKENGNYYIKIPGVMSRVNMRLMWDAAAFSLIRSVSPLLDSDCPMEYTMPVFANRILLQTVDYKV